MCGAEVLIYPPSGSLSADSQPSSVPTKMLMLMTDWWSFIDTFVLVIQLENGNISH